MVENIKAMKKTCIIFLALLLANIRFGFAQNTPEFAPVGAEWYFSYVIGSFYPDQGYAIQKVIKDTNVEGLDCKLLEYFVYSNRGQLIGAHPTYSREVWRSDGISSKRYSKGWNEQFKYRNKGDTFHLLNPNAPNLPPVVYYIFKVDTIWLNGKAYPDYKYYRDSIPTDTLLIRPYSYIQHIGGWNGLQVLQPDKPTLDTMFYSSEYFAFRCYHSPSVDYKNPENFGWWKSTYPCDTTYLKHFIYNDVADHAQSKEEDIQVYPNPTRDIIRINASEKILNIELYTISGDRRAAWHEPGSTISLEKLNLSPGIYILKIKTHENILFKKVYKVH